MPRMQTSIPTRKVTAGALAGAVTTILIAVLGRSGISLSNEVAVAITTVVTFVASYFIPPAERDQVVATQPDGRQVP